MLDKRKVRLMTRLALYEQNEGREDMTVSYTHLTLPTIA